MRNIEFMTSIFRIDPSKLTLGMVYHRMGEQKICKQRMMC